MKRIAAALLLTASMLMPVAGFARDRRYYDTDARDCHVWSHDEDRAYHHWLMEERREARFRTYNHLRAEQQRDYWRWRHAHPDWR